MENNLIDISVYEPAGSSLPKCDNNIWTMSAEEFEKFLDNAAER